MKEDETQNQWEQITITQSKNLKHLAYDSIRVLRTDFLVFFPEILGHHFMIGWQAYSVACEANGNK